MMTVYHGANELVTKEETIIPRGETESKKIYLQQPLIKLRKIGTSPVRIKVTQTQ
jgi:hypothetical protein